MEDVLLSSLGHRPRRAGAQKDYRDPGNDEGDDAEDADSNSDDDDESMEDVEGEEEGEDDDEELEEDDDDDDDSAAPRRSSRRRIQHVRSSLEGPPKQRKGGGARRTSSRSTKFTSSMAEPSSNSIQDLFASVKGSAAPHKSPARRHKERRRSLAGERLTPSSAESSESEEEEEQEELFEEEEEEPMKVQRIIASRTETLQKWKEIGATMNTTEITYGSRWIQNSQKDGDGDQTMPDTSNAFQERFLVKWTDFSFLHVSWETQADLVGECDNAKSYLTTFFRKSAGGLLYSPDERCDGDYFDPAYTQVERILEVQLPDDWDDAMPRRREGDRYDYGMVLDRADPEFESGAGRQFLVKWGNLPYSDSTYEFERDLILNEIEYGEPLNEFLRRNQKPTKAGRRSYLNSGDEEQRRLYRFLGDNVTKYKGKKLSDEEREAAVEEYKQRLQDRTYKNGGQLRDYQAEGVAWMLANFVNKRSAILADEMVRLFAQTDLSDASLAAALTLPSISVVVGARKDATNRCHGRHPGDETEP